MLKPQVRHQNSPIIKTLISVQKPTFHRHGNCCLPLQLTPPASPNKSSRKNIHVGFSTGNIKAIASVTEKSTTVKAIVTVQKTLRSILSIVSIGRRKDDIQDFLGKTLLLELVSAELDPKTGLQKPTIKGYARRTGEEQGNVIYESEFEVPPEFGEVGAVMVENQHHSEMYVKDIVLDGLPVGPVNITCRSFVHSRHNNRDKRVFYTTKSYLPLQTPNGLKRIRENELANVRGTGLGECQRFERVYDYDVYNDIGDPDRDLNLARPVLGGQERPYPRRCRTGRPRCKKDPCSERKPSDTMYVPRDEAFSEIKQEIVSAKAVNSVLNALLPSSESETAIESTNLGFPYSSIMKSLHKGGSNLLLRSKERFWNVTISRLLKTVKDTRKDASSFNTPELMMRDILWLRDEEFARQTLAGLNPLSIQLITEWPLKSTLNPEIYGSPDSVITPQLIEKEIKGFITVDEAIKQKKLFILDYHDLLLPYVEKVRQLKDTILYGSRTIFFLTPCGTLKPVAIELTRPPMNGQPQWKQAFTPSSHSTALWLWELAKTHVIVHDSGYHQLVSHWLRTHCCTEPYILATNRQLSEMHPIYRLLDPHFRYTLEINSIARQFLINADGIIESSFSLGKYSMELSSVAYDKQWRFDYEALPKDLIRRGMAVEDPSAPHGLRLTIEDYPYANDGLVLWNIIKQWVSDYVNHYYPIPNLIESDQELKAWWLEIRHVGHADKKDEPWWPTLKTPQDLVDIVTTIVWVTSGLHAAMNFGQYTYAGYFPNRPTIARLKMPTEDPSKDEWKNFMEKPEATLLACFPSNIQSTRVRAVLGVLSNHSTDETYLGDKIEPPWDEDPIIKKAFKRFNDKLKELERIIDERNADSRLMNRNGAGIIPYELLKPFSEPGITGKGVPCNISI